MNASFWTFELKFNNCVLIPKAVVSVKFDPNSMNFDRSFNIEYCSTKTPEIFWMLVRDCGQLPRR